MYAFYIREVSAHCLPSLKHREEHSCADAAKKKEREVGGMKKRFEKMNFGFALITAATLFLTACGSGNPGGQSVSAPANSRNGADADASGSKGGAYKDVLSVAIRDEPASLDPHLNTQLVSEAVRREIYDFLVIKDEEGNLQPSLATGWENVDDTTIRFSLRDDVIFHNGEKMTAEDVRYTIVRASEKSGSAPLFQSVDTENTKVIDNTTLELKLKEPMAPIFNFLSSPEGGILCKKAVEELGDDEFGRSPVGSGPLKLKNWTTGTSIELERNDEYWGEKPAYKTLLVKFIAEPANRTIELETGGVDLIYDVSTNDIERISENEELRLISGTGLKHTYISISMEDPVMKDIRVREALAYALDMDSIVDAVFTGTAKTSDSVISPNIFGYKSMGVNPYDPDQARALLKEAGYEDSLEITVKGYDNTQFVDILEIAQNMWKAVGVTAKVDIMEYAAFAEQEAAGEIQLGISAFTASSGDPDQALGLWKSGYGGVLQGNDAKIDEYLDKGRSVYDETEREALYQEAQEYMWNTHYMIPIAFSDVVYATTAKVENLECSPGNTPNLAKVVVYE